MSFQRHLLYSLLSIAAPALAQSASPPLNLKVPADPVAADSSTAATAADPEPGNAAAAPSPRDALPPYVYAEPYGTRRDAAAKACDDNTYGQPQIHGSVEMGVAGGNRVGGNYQAASIAMTKALGSCGDPKGLVGVSIHVEQDNANRRRPGRP